MGSEHSNLIVISRDDPDQHDEYEKLRKVWNDLIDLYPLFIIRCSSEEDISQALQFARDRNLEFSVRCGGHSICGYSTIQDGVMIDLSLMTKVQVDDKKKIVHVDGGCVWKHVDEKTKNMAVVGGMVSHTGVAGLTLGGGIGWLSRAYGLTCDNLVSARLVLADGKVITVSEEENSELLFGLRGAGSNFGIVSQFTFAMKELSYLDHGMFVYDFEDAIKVMEFYFEWTNTERTHPLPNNVSVYMFLSKENVILMPLYHEGDITMDLSEKERLAAKETFENLLLEMNNLGPIYSTVQSLSYLTLQSQFDEGNRHGRNYYWKSLFFNTVPNGECIKSLVQCIRLSPGTSSIEFMHLGGAIAGKQPSGAAFCHRDVKYEMHSMSVWDGSEEDVNVYKNWSKVFHDSISKYSSNKSGYVNTTTQDLSKIEEFYGCNYEKLLNLKRKYDPTNRFNRNHNIKP